MQCYRTKDIVWRSKDGNTGTATVRCGSCIPCLIDKANEWAFRCALEYSTCGVGCVLTLTIDEDHIDRFQDGVSRREIQLFLKRLRRRTKAHIRYFGCGEYGSLFGRPHYHVIIFGWRPDDMKFFKMSDAGNKIYVSHQLSQIWTYGFATIEDFDERAAVYSSKYLNKIKEPLPDKNPPFTFMSLKPSIGFDAILNSGALDRGYVYYRGNKTVIPRSYYQSLKRYGIEFKELAFERQRYVKSIDEDETFLKKKKSFHFSENLLDKLHRF